jgi:hypothetical protein
MGHKTEEWEGEREMFGTFDFIANLMKVSFPAKKEIYSAIDGDFNAWIKRTNG